MELLTSAFRILISGQSRISEVKIAKKVLKILFLLKVYQLLCLDYALDVSFQNSYSWGGGLSQPIIPSGSRSLNDIDQHTTSSDARGPKNLVNLTHGAKGEDKR